MQERPKRLHPYWNLIKSDGGFIQECLKELHPFFALLKSDGSGHSLNYMYLLEGKPVPDNATIARFIFLHFAQCSKELMAESTWLLRRNGLISSEVVFIDGTKIEANANKYDILTVQNELPLGQESIG